MITGTGTDIVDIRRIGRAVNEHGMKFTEKILSPEEISRIPSSRSEQYIAGRFAAKEALVKASGISFTFSDITILNDENGRPYVKAGSESLNIPESHNIHISISHEDDYAVAFAVIDS